MAVTPVYGTAGAGSLAPAGSGGGTIASGFGYLSHGAVGDIFLMYVAATSTSGSGPILGAIGLGATSSSYMNAVADDSRFHRHTLWISHPLTAADVADGSMNLYSDQGGGFAYLATIWRGCDPYNPVAASQGTHDETYLNYYPGDGDKPLSTDTISFTARAGSAALAFFDGISDAGFQAPGFSNPTGFGAPYVTSTVTAGGNYHSRQSLYQEPISASPTGAATISVTRTGASTGYETMAVWAEMLVLQPPAVGVANAAAASGSGSASDASIISRRGRSKFHLTGSSLLRRRR